MIKIGVIGIGRMGKIHLENLSRKIVGVEVLAAVNPGDKGQNFARELGIPIVSDDVNVILENEEIDAVLISSPSSSHADYALAVARKGKAVFCEKPIDMSLEKARQTIALIAEFKVPIMIAFNQRFDANFSKVKTEILNDRIGDIRSLHIISRDPAPPPVSFIKSSGGLFMDMTIHDFDMARFIMGSEVTEVFATGGCLIDSAIEEAGDIDSATVLLKFENGAVATIENSREAVYGYDQRLEVFGSKGVIKVENPLKSDIKFSGAEGTKTDRHLNFFMDRYEESYLHEMNAFISALQNGTAMPVSGSDGLKAMIIAEAANKSRKENRPIRVESI